MIDHAVQSVKQNRPLLRFRQFSRFHRNELRNLCQQIKIHLLIRKDTLFLLRGASTPRCDAQLSATGIGQNPISLQKAKCLCPTKSEIAYTELSTHAWHDTQPAGSGTNTGSGASLAGTCLIGTGKRRVHPNGREGNADKCSLRPKVFIKNVRTYILFLPLSKNKKLWKRFYWMKSTNSCCSKSLY